MSIYAISDLHLSTNTDKSMEVFGEKWNDYMGRIARNWRETVGENDTVIIGGDISWEMKLDDCVSDFEFIQKLPGRKILSKGNHDYWWETASKHQHFKEKNGFDSIDFIYNNAYIAEGVAICGTRLWDDPSTDGFSEDDNKIYTHELLRLENSLSAASKLGCDRKIAVLHYPPFTTDGKVNKDISSMFSHYGVTCCVYGHLHGAGLKNAISGEFNGVNYCLTSADYLDFAPISIKI